MTLNQKAFNEGMSLVATKHGIPATDIVKIAGLFDWIRGGLDTAGEGSGVLAGANTVGQFKGVLGGLGLDPSKMGRGAVAGAVGIPALAALWYAHNAKPKQEKKAADGLNINDAVGAGLTGIPLLSALGAWHYLNYRKGSQDTGEDIDSILNINPAGQHQITQEPKALTRPPHMK